jgi:hypothetical protein
VTTPTPTTHRQQHVRPPRILALQVLRPRAAPLQRVIAAFDMNGRNDLDRPTRLRQLPRRRDYAGKGRLEVVDEFVEGDGSDSFCAARHARM